MKKDIPYKKIVIGVSVLIFLVFNVVGFNPLHPGKWAQENRLRYDYGFWDTEKDGAGNEFRWTKECAGIYLTLDKKGESGKIKLFCGAPLAHLKGKKQEVEIYWQGKLYKEIIFTENEEFYFTIKSQPLEAGFLEVRVIPVFNLRKMGLGAEIRNLGVQFSTTRPNNAASFLTF